MNKNPKIASTYKGSLLLSIRMFNSHEPAFEVKDMEAKDRNEADKLVNIKFTARFDLEYV